MTRASKALSWLLKIGLPAIREEAGARDRRGHVIRDLEYVAIAEPGQDLELALDLGCSTWPTGS